MNQEELQHLLRKYNNHEASPEERRMVEDWYERVNGDTPNNESFELSALKETMFDHVQLRIGSGQTPPQKRTFKLYQSWLFKAAILFLVLVGGTYLYFAKTDTNFVASNQFSKTKQIKPGGDNAILHLADGSQIVLNEAADGQVADQPGVEITKTKSGELIYKFTGQSNTQEVKYNTITTPRGGQYHLILVDGTDVWLNANSSIKFPTIFANNTRKVQITGEVYFEVSKDKSKPFIVNTNQTSIKVLGTHFNVNAYDDEECQRTTLLEGSIELSKGKEKQLILPGQQASTYKTSDLIKLKEVDDLDAVIAWKNGYFQFERADLQSVMRQISRWYDTEVTYNGKIPTKEYSGKMPRNAEVNKLIEMLAYTGIHCKVYQGKIIVNPK
ncbi:FecR family protein [Pedobacter endophyticus]|uniref:FecR domain-containing protein n=1 Tax=Pedobacter endophyticus TaxID=2789740 RepID=A0A7S9L0M2_9SPHI|nr:FecR family protein [Pedobacter endophyticus]QPH40314.1 FecR domain-containing protein [Pedobacter endophyticus]